jgi:GH24 family phage-related lysozyme (muramidase)
MSTVVDHVSNNRGKYAGMSAALATAAVLFISPWEGYFSHPYRDSVGVETICYGQTAADHADFSKTYTKAQCLQMLKTDLPKYDAPLQRCIKPEVFNSLPIPRHVALISLSYNIGGAAVCKSRIVVDLNAGRVQAACNDFLAYNHAGGRVLKGLSNRRAAERKLCLEEK